MSRNAGMTLIETVLVITMIGFVAVGSALVFQPVIDGWSMGQERSEATGSAGFALRRMTAEIAQLRDAQSVLTADAGEFRFTDVDGNAVRFHLSGSQLMRNADVLARGVVSLAFSYWDINNASLATPAVSPSDTDIWRLSIRVTSQNGNQNVALETDVHPRNLRRP